MKLCERFDAGALSLGRKLAVREKDRDWSYDQLLRRSEDLSEFLLSMAIGKGHNVAVMLPNSGAFVMSLFSILRTGAAAVPLNDRYKDQELIFYIGDAAPSALIVSPDAAARVDRALSSMKLRPAFVEVSPDGSFSKRNEGETAPGRIAEVSQHPVLVQFTSGSTGTPKRVVRTDDQLCLELSRLSQVFELDKDDRFLGAAPFSHVNGLVRTLLASMVNGGTLYPVRSFNRREVLDILSRERISYFGAVPYMYIALTVTPLRGAVDLSGLRVAFSSSAPLLSDDNLAFAQKYGMHIRQLYGCTEMGTISVNMDPDPRDSLESVGLPLEDVRVEIFNDDRQIIEDGREGEVGVASPTGIQAYVNNPEANAQSFMDGFYFPGDLGFKDHKGRLTLTGRKKFLINRGGYEINPVECEKAIMTHPRVEEAVVIGVPTKHGDQALKSLVVVNAPCTEREIMEHCRSLIADHKIPGVIEFVKSLPKSPTGKILREKCS